MKTTDDIKQAVRAKYAEIVQQDRADNAASRSSTSAGSEADAMEAFRRVRDQVKAYCRELTNEQQGRSSGDNALGTPE